MNQDGRIPDEARQGDILAIEDLAISYAHAVDDRDWGRWEALFTPDAVVDYTSAGGIMGNPAELAAWFPDAADMVVHALDVDHEIRFGSGEDEATGRVHVLNRNGVVDSEAEILDDRGGLPGPLCAPGRPLVVRRAHRTHALHRRGQVRRDAQGHGGLRTAGPVLSPRRSPAPHTARLDTWPAKDFTSRCRSSMKA